ncbi:MAG: BLUF domain-containing protein [Desulfocapsaceae bacterium]|nr:BLUF domain-containing protein [Desulfocapsaceae bacterium]
MHRIIYKSTAEGEIDKETFRDILYTSVQMNRKHGITGALIATRKYYLQFLEGEPEVVEKTYSSICKDSRHKDIKLIASRSVRKALFSQWRMRGFGLFDLNLQTEKRLKEKYGEEDGSIYLPEDESGALAMFEDVEMIDPS